MNVIAAINFVLLHWNKNFEPCSEMLSGFQFQVIALLGTLQELIHTSRSATIIQSRTEYS
jgi:hypothetical protein